MYDVFVFKANANPLKSRANPINAFLASFSAKTGVLAVASMVPIFSKAAKNRLIKNLVKVLKGRHKF